MNGCTLRMIPPPKTPYELDLSACPFLILMLHAYLVFGYSSLITWHVYTLMFSSYYQCKAHSPSKLIFTTGFICAYTIISRL